MKNIIEFLKIYSNYIYFTIGIILFIIHSHIKYKELENRLNKIEHPNKDTIKALKDKKTEKVDDIEDIFK